MKMQGEERRNGGEMEGQEGASFLGGKVRKVLIARGGKKKHKRGKNPFIRVAIIRYGVSQKSLNKGHSGSKKGRIPSRRSRAKKSGKSEGGTKSGKRRAGQKKYSC